MKTKRIISEKDVKNFFNTSINSIEDAMGIVNLDLNEQLVTFDFNAVLLLSFETIYAGEKYSISNENFDKLFIDILQKSCEMTISKDTEFTYDRLINNNNRKYSFKLEKLPNSNIKIYVICINILFETEKQLSIFSNVVGAGISMFTGSTWWIDYDRFSDHFYQSPNGPALLGMDIQDDYIYSTVEFQKVRDKAKTVSKFYDESIIAETESYERLRNNETDYFAGRTPAMTSNEEVVWVEAYGKCLIRYKDGTPRFFVAIDIYLSDIFEKTNQFEILKNLTEYGLISSDIGVWYHQRYFSEGRYNFTESYQKLMGNDDVLYSNESFTELFDQQIEIMKSLGNGYETYLNEFRETHNNIYTKGLNKYHIVIPHLKNKDTLIWVDVRGTVIERDEEGYVQLFVGVNVDVTESYNRRQELEELRIKNERLQLAENLAVQARDLLVWYLAKPDENGERQIYGNIMFEEKLGIHRDTEGMIKFSDLRKTLVVEDEKSKELTMTLLNELRLVIYNKKDSFKRILAKHKNLKTGEILYLEHSVQVSESTATKNERMIGGILLEVTENIVYQEQINYLANYDTLTDTKNRNYFENYIKDELPSTYTVLIFDVDGLKLVNDAFGHIDGDNIIKLLANFLKEIFIDSLFVSRIGGDEFVVLTEDVDSVSITNHANALEEKITSYNKISSIEINVSKGGISVVDNDISFDKAFVLAENIMYRRKLNNRSSRKSKVLESILETLSAKTEETKAHSDRMAELAVKTLNALGMVRSSEVEDMKLLARVHDIGKITILDEILHKSDRLNKVEFEMIKKHSDAGYKIIRNITDSDNVCNGVLLHHERWDGNGYPQGLKGEEIPIYARIISVVDTYDAITNNRVYQPRRTQEEAIEEIIKCSGSQFDPKVVSHFLKACFNIEYKE